jgi:hypothetical protein
VAGVRAALLLGAADFRVGLPASENLTDKQIVHSSVQFPRDTKLTCRHILSLCFDCALVLLQVVYDFVDSLEQLTSMTYSLATTFPKVIYGPDKLQQTISQLNLAPQAAMLVQPHDDD